MPSGVRRKLTCLLFGLSGLALGVIGAETTFGRLRSDASSALLFSLELRDEAGALLARPMLGSEEGRKVHLDLSPPVGPHSDPVEMSLDLSPPATKSGGLCVEYNPSLY